MSKLHFDYWMEISYSVSASQCHYTFKCLPQDTPRQRILALEIEVTPHHEYEMGVDSFGNRTIYDDLYFPHDRFGFHISGIAETGLAAGEPEEAFPAIYRYPHGLNRAGDGIKAYYRELMAPMGIFSSDYAKAIYLMNSLYGDFQYASGATSVNTTAEEAWLLRRGVCQDYSHILIALCHLAGIPARYVTGMMTGEGFSHAWVEILSDGVWYGLDPTNGCLAEEEHIRIGVGRDARDCLINKGVITGGGLQTQTVVVRVEPAE